MNTYIKSHYNYSLWFYSQKSFIQENVVKHMVSSFIICFKHYNECDWHWSKLLVTILRFLLRKFKWVDDIHAIHDISVALITLWNNTLFPVTDTIALLGVVLCMILVTVYLHAPWVCNLYLFFMETYAAIPNWILVSIALERMIGVLFPHRIHLWATNVKFSIFLAVLMLVTIIPFLVFVYFVEYDTFSTNMCKMDGNAMLQEAQAIGSSLIVSGLPSFFIVTFNMIIIGRLIYTYRMQHHLTTSNVSSHTTQITISLIAVSAAFVLLTWPHNIHKMYIHYSTIYERYLYLYLRFSIFQILIMLNNGINFWLYCMTGKDFRHRVAHCLCKICSICKRHRNSSG